MHTESPETKTVNVSCLRIAVAAAIITNFVLIGAGLFWFRHEVPDSSSYLDFSTSMVMQGELYIGRELGLFRTPGYPLLIYAANFLFQRSAIPVVILQAILSVGIAVLSFKILNICGYYRVQNPSIKWLVILLLNATLMLDATYFFTTFSILSESFFTFLVLLAVLLALSASPQRRSILRFLLLGFILGLAALTKPIGQFLVLSFSLYILATRKLFRLSSIATFVLGFSLVIGPWIYRNSVLYGFSGLSCVGSFNLVYYRASAIIAAKDGLSMDEVNKILEKKFPTCDMTDKQAEEMKKYSIQTFEENLSLSLKQVLRAGSMFFFDPGGSYVAQGFSIAPTESGILSKIMVNGFKEVLFYLKDLNGQTWIVLIWSALYLAFEYLCLLVFVLKAKRLSPHVENRKMVEFMWLFFLISIPIVAFSLGPETTSRFRAPLIPFVTLLAVSLASSFFQALDSRLINRRQSWPIR